MIKEFYKRLHDKISSSDSTAYTYYNERYSYRDLYRYMKRLNSRLADYKQKQVVLLGSKTIGVYAAIYSIILSGNIWIPCSPNYPVKRLLEIFEVLEASIIIFEEELPQEIKGFAERKKMLMWNLGDLLEEERERGFKDFNFSDSDLAYIMFTSGSTGTPKGVPMTHRNYINFIDNVIEILPMQKREVFSDYHDFSFDISIFYLFCAPLTESAISPIRKEEERIFPVRHFQENKITVWSSVPSVISRIQRLRPNEEIKNFFSILFLCGEPFNLAVLHYCYENLKAKKVYNFYGLTETGVENFYHECSIDDVRKYESKGFVPVGKPLKGNDIKISAEKELLLSGCQVTPGYLRGVETAKFEVISGKRWYHTGDIIERFEDVYFCKGRLDSQVKLSGYRIELMDIETHVKKIPAVKEAVCFVDSGRSATLLVCVYEPDRGISVDEKVMKRQLQKSLPEYMIPKRFFALGEMPRNKNGKLDRKSVKDMYFSSFFKKSNR